MPDSPWSRRLPPLRPEGAPSSPPQRGGAPSVGSPPVPPSGAARSSKQADPPSQSSPIPNRSQNKVPGKRPARRPPTPILLGVAGVVAVMLVAVLVLRSRGGDPEVVADPVNSIVTPSSDTTTETVPPSTQVQVSLTGTVWLVRWCSLRRCLRVIGEARDRSCLTAVMC